MLYETQNPHGGDVYGMEVRLDFSSNVNPLGPPPSVISAMQRACAQVRQYPDPYCRALTRAIAAHEGVPERSILCGAGAARFLCRGSALCPRAQSPRLFRASAERFFTIYYYYMLSYYRN